VVLLLADNFNIEFLVHVRTYLLFCDLCNSMMELSICSVFSSPFAEKDAIFGPFQILVDNFIHAGNNLLLVNFGHVHVANDPANEFFGFGGERPKHSAIPLQTARLSFQTASSEERTKEKNLIKMNGQQ